MAHGRWWFCAACRHVDWYGHEYFLSRPWCRICKDTRRVIQWRPRLEVPGQQTLFPRGYVDGDVCDPTDQDRFEYTRNQMLAFAETVTPAEYVDPAVRARRRKFEAPYRVSGR